MNLTLEEIKKYISAVKDYKGFIICPSALYLPYFIDAGFTVGVQNISEFGLGCYTGEISVNQANSMGIEYTIIGHSERRENFNETDDIVNRKLRKAVSNNLIAILCIGETLEEKNTRKTKDKIKKQIYEDIKNVDKSCYSNIVVAYEPIWAIGTGNIPSVEEISDIILFIKETINDIYGFIPCVLYGGSTNEKNIKELNNIDIIDGFLVGGACLVPEKFIKMIETVN